MGYKHIAASLSALLLTSIITVVVVTDRVHNVVATTILIIALLLSLNMLLKSAVDGGSRLPSMFLLIFFTFFYVFPALFQSSSANFFWTDILYDNETAALAAFIILLFLVFFHIGQIGGAKNQNTTESNNIPISNRNTPYLIIYVLVIVSVVIGLNAIRRFGIDFFLTSRGAFGDTLLNRLDLSELGLMIYLPRALMFVSLLMVFYLLLGQRNKPRNTPRKLIAIALFLIVFPIFSVINFPGALSRYWLFGMAIALVILFFPLNSVRRRVIFLVSFFVAVFSIFPIAAQFSRGNYFNPDVSVPDFSEYLLHGDFDGYQTTMNVVVYAERYGHTLGRQAMSAALFFVPRQFWPDKGWPTGKMTADALGFGYTNLSAPIVAELYVDWSFLGVAIGGFLIGFLYRKLDHISAVAIGGSGITLNRILVAVVCGFTIIVMRGSLLAIISPIFVSLASIVMVMKFSRYTESLGGSLRGSQ